MKKKLEEYRKIVEQTEQKKEKNEKEKEKVEVEKEIIENKMKEYDQMNDTLKVQINDLRAVIKQDLDEMSKFNREYKKQEEKSKAVDIEIEDFVVSVIKLY